MAVLRLLAILISTAILLNAETVEVNPEGETVTQNCDCGPAIQKTLVTADQQCLQRLEAHELSVTSPFKEKLADLEKQLNHKDDLIRALQNQKETAEREHDEKVLQLRRNAISAAEHTRKVENQFTDCNTALQSTVQREQSIKIDTAAAMETLKKELDEARAQKSAVDSTVQKLRGEVETHQKNLIEAKDSLTKQLDIATGQLKSELHEIKSHKSKADGLVEKLKSEVDSHKNDLHKSKNDFTRELNSERAKFKETHHKFFTSQRDLLKASERLDEFHRNVTTTYVNFTLIQIDMTVGVIKAADWTVKGTQEAREFIAPYWAKFVGTVVTPNWKLAVKQYQEHVAPLLSKVEKEASDRYEEHMKETVDKITVYTKKHVVPRLEPVREFVILVHQTGATLIQHGSISVVHFLELSDFDRSSLAYQWLLASFKYSSEYGFEVLYAFLKYLLYFWILRLFVFRNIFKRAADKPLDSAKGKETPKPKAKLSFSSTTGKKPRKENGKKKSGKHH